MKIECFPAAATGYSSMDLTIDPRVHPRRLYDQYVAARAHEWIKVHSMVGMNGCCGAAFGFDAAHIEHNSANKGILLYLNPEDPVALEKMAERRNMEVVEIPVGEDRLVYLFAKEDK